MPKTHELKIWPGPFADVVDGRKRFEWRKDDRGFEVGDTLLLREIEPYDYPGNPVRCVHEHYTGHEVEAEVTHLVRGDDAPKEWGIPRGYCIMSIRLRPGVAAPRTGRSADPASRRDPELDAAVRKLKARKPRLPLRRK